MRENTSIEIRVLTTTAFEQSDLKAVTPKLNIIEMKVIKCEILFLLYLGPTT